MVAAELGVPRGRAGAGGYAWTVGRVFVLLWVVTLVAAVAVGALGVGAPVRHWLRLRLSPDATASPSLAAVVLLAAHNLPVCAWPLLLLAIGAQRARSWRRFADGFVVAALAVNVSLVGVAFGAYGARLLPYVPQLPLEWLALAAGAAGWLSATARTGRRACLLAAALTASAVLAAAVVETYAAPHRRATVRRARPAFAGGVKRDPAATYR